MTMTELVNEYILACFHLLHPATSCIIDAIQRYFSKCHLIQLHNNSIFQITKSQLFENINQHD